MACKRGIRVFELTRDKGTTMPMICEIFNGGLCLSTSMKWISSPTSLVQLATWPESNPYTMLSMHTPSLAYPRISPRLVVNVLWSQVMRYV